MGHIALRQMCQENPLALFSIMASDECDQFLADIWQQIKDNCDAEGEAGFDIAEMTITPCRIKRYPSLVIRMPTPGEAAEAYLVAIVLKIDTELDSLPEKPETDYFTLEKGMNLDGSGRSVLCDWGNDDTHMNFGDGPAVNEKAFVTAVEKMV